MGFGSSGVVPGFCLLRAWGLEGCWLVLALWIAGDSSRRFVGRGGDCWEPPLPLRDNRGERLDALMFHMSVSIERYDLFS